MITLVDIGNTYTKYCLVDENSVVFNRQVVKNSEISVHWLSLQWGESNSIILASVQQASLVTLIKEWANKNLLSFKQVYSEEKAFGVHCGYVLASQLGVDRWLALLGAYSLYPNKNLIIVDSGTATTIDILSADGQHHGGWILPGVDMMQTSLLTNTAQISQHIIHRNEDHDKDNKHKAIKQNDLNNQISQLTSGDNTFDNIFHGSWLATVGAVNIAVAHVKDNINPLDHIILTGGNAEPLAKHLSLPSIVNDNLIFYGLKKYI